MRVHLQVIPIRRGVVRIKFSRFEPDKAPGFEEAHSSTKARVWWSSEPGKSPSPKSYKFLYAPVRRKFIRVFFPKVSHAVTDSSFIRSVSFIRVPLQPGVFRSVFSFSPSGSKTTAGLPSSFFRLSPSASFCFLLWLRGHPKATSSPTRGETLQDAWLKSPPWL